MVEDKEKFENWRLGSHCRRCEWRLGRVVKPILKGEHVRKVEVRCIDGKTILRDRTKIVLLELDGEENKDDTQA